VTDRRGLFHGVTFPPNPPGRPALTYRVRSFEMFTREMMDRLALMLENGNPGVAPADAEGRPQLPIRINLGGPDHWLSALVKSWATVADVLTFYQERILQEGFLRTAVEDRSIHELVQMIGYRPRPAVAGGGEVALLISDVKGLPQDLDLPPGLVIRSVPPPGAEPQVFETLHPLRARAAWNRLTPVPATASQPPNLLGASREASLQGTATGLATGSGLLIRAGWQEPKEAFFRLLTQVKVQPGSPAYTDVAWANPLDLANPQRELTGIEILGLRQQAGLFGQNAPSWKDLPPEIRLQAQPLPGGVVLAAPGAWQSANQGLPVTTAVRCLAVDADGRLYAGTSTEGVFRSTDRGATWKPARRGLAQPGVEALAVTADGSLFAGTPGGGVYRSTDAGEIWEPANGSAMAGTVRRRWPLRRGPLPGALPATTVRALAVAAWDDRTVLFAGTDSGIFRSEDAGRSWLPANEGLPGTDAATGVTDLVVQSLAAGPDDGQLYAGTVRGVFQSSHGGRRWRDANRGIPASDPFTGLSTTVVHALVSYRDRRQSAHHLVAGTSAGLFLSSDGGASWRASQQGPGAGTRGPAEVLSLAVSDDPVTRVIRVYAGTPEGIWSSLDHGESWTAIALDGGPPRVEALAAGPAGEPVLAATPFGTFGPEWPDFRIRNGQIDLDGVVPGIVSGSWLALRPGDAAVSPGVGIYRVRRVSTVQRRDFGLSATITRLEVESPDARLAEYDLRQTRVYLLSESLALHAQAFAVVPASIGLLRAELLAFGDQPRRVIVVGKTPPARLGEKVLAKEGDLISALNGLATQVAPLDPAQEIIVRVWPAGKEDELPLLETRVLASELQEILDEPGGGARSRDDIARSQEATKLLSIARPTVVTPVAGGVVVALFLASRTEGAALWATDLADSLREPLAVKGESGADGAPLHTVTLRPTSPLVTLDASTLVVYCNVVAVAEGVTVRSEVVGDGDAAKANQSFQIARPPAFLRDEPPQPTLEVTVQDQRWTEVSALHAEGGDGRVYRVQLDHDGRATLIFGDGEAGARLPSGEGNVKATYRTGMTTSSVSPGGLSLLVTRPLGLDAVTNPLPTSPGAPAEGHEQIRVRAPLKVRTLDRVVSLRDYEDYARLFPGVEKAGAWPLTANGGPVVQITLAAAGGAQPDPDLVADLTASIDARRSHLTPMDVQGYRAVWVRFHAVVRGDSQAFHLWQELYRPEAAQVYPAKDWKISLGEEINGALEAELGFAASRFGGAVSAAAVTSVIQRVPGVVAVDLDEWDGSREETADHPWERRAAPPTVDPETGAITPAELVLLDLPAPDEWEILEVSPA